MHTAQSKQNITTVSKSVHPFSLSGLTSNLKHISSMSIPKLEQSVINIKTVVLWDVMLCSLVGGCQRSVFR